MKKIEGELDGSGLDVAVVVGRFNGRVTDRLIDGAEDKLSRLGVDNMSLVKVPGAFELPRGVKEVSEGGKYDGVVALGAVVRGETPHFEYVSSEASKGLAELSLELKIPVSFGLITADTMDQALDRAGGKKNKGAGAAESLVEMINVEKKV